MPPADYANYLDKLFTERKNNAKKLDIYSEELATFWGQSLVSQAEKNGENFVILHRIGADLKFLVRAVETIVTQNNALFVYLSGDDQMPVSTVAATGKKK